ncbi:MAG: hypothetical protein ACRDTE_19660 [Pseudonocardiaceae bacterium]
MGNVRGVIGAGAIADPQAAAGEARNRADGEIRGSIEIGVSGGKRVRAADGGTAVNDIRRCRAAWAVLVRRVVRVADW